jgi:hypothetical protein
MNTPLNLQDRRVQYAILAIAVIAILVLLFMFVLQGNPSSVGTPTSEITVGPPGGPVGGPAGDPTLSLGGPGVSSPAGPTFGPGGPVGGDPAAAGNAAAFGYGAPTGQFGQPAQQAAAPRGGPKPPRRADPFRHLISDVDQGFQAAYEQQTREPSVADELAAVGVQPAPLYQTMRAEQQLEEAMEAAAAGAVGGLDPPMRMAGVIHGNRVSGILEISGQPRVVRPGEAIGPYRVERIERERMVLSRPMSGGKRRMIDVPLQANPSLQQQFGTGAPGAPGFSGGSGPGAPPGLGFPSSG